jgi:uncharacterized protein (TIGR03435 family)
MQRLFVAAGLTMSVITAAPPAFEVASVKPSVSGFNGVRGGCHGVNSQYSPTELPTAPPLGRCVITDGRLSHLIAIAYGLPVQSIQNAPDWVIAGDDRFTIEAKAEEPAKATEQQLLEMLQNLLADRFQLKFHRETKDMPGFGMVVAKNGPKNLTQAKGDEVVTSFGGDAKPNPRGPVTLTARKYSMSMLADLLSKIGQGVTVDKTGLQGEYDFRLSWDESAGPSLFTAVQEQLGLRLESQKVPVSFFILESAKKPSAN